MGETFRPTEKLTYNKHRYILNAIDVLSKKAYAVKSLHLVPVRLDSVYLERLLLNAAEIN